MCSHNVVMTLFVVIIDMDFGEDIIKVPNLHIMSSNHIDFC